MASKIDPKFLFPIDQWNERENGLPIHSSFTPDRPHPALKIGQGHSTVARMVATHMVLWGVFPSALEWETMDYQLSCQLRIGDSNPIIPWDTPSEFLSDRVRTCILAHAAENARKFITDKQPAHACLPMLKVMKMFYLKSTMKLAGLE